MRKLMLVIVLALGAGAARADDTFYLGAGISRNELSDVTNGGLSYSDISRTAWKAYAGIRPINFLAFELDYLDLGSQTSSFVAGTTSSNGKAFAGYAVGFLPIPVPFLDIFGKAGLSRWQLNGNGSSAGGGSVFSFSNTGTEFAWGVGAQAHVGSFGGRLEYEGFNIPNTSGARVVSLSVYLLL